MKLLISKVYTDLDTTKLSMAKQPDCIPFQLQKLFATLQLQHSRFCDTRELTKSFQWDNGNSFEQQDIQVSAIITREVFVKMGFRRNFTLCSAMQLNKLLKDRRLTVSWVTCSKGLS